MISIIVSVLTHDTGCDLTRSPPLPTSTLRDPHALQHAGIRSATSLHLHSSTTFESAACDSRGVACCAENLDHITNPRIPAVPKQIWSVCEANNGLKWASELTYHLHHSSCVRRRPSPKELGMSAQRCDEHAASAACSSPH